MQNDWIERVEHRLASLETQNAVAAVHQGNVAERLTAIEDTLKWLMRLVVGGLILGLITYVIQGGLLPG